MPLRSRRHSFALDGATLVAAEPAALVPANAALGGSTAHGIRVGDDGRPRHQHATDNDAGGGSSDTASDHGTTAAGGAKKGAEHHQSSTAAGGGVATTTHVVPRAEMGVAGGTPDPATYTPYPATWPSRGDVVRARTSLLGPQAPDMWALPSAPRFSNAEKTQTPIGPSTYAPTRLGTRDHRTPRVLPSSLPRFPPVAGNPRIAPGTYAVDPVPVPHGFRPWVRARVTHAWPPRPSPSAAERKAGVIAGFADARRVVLVMCKKWKGVAVWTVGSIHYLMLWFGGFPLSPSLSLSLSVSREHRVDFPHPPITRRKTPHLQSNLHRLRRAPQPPAAATRQHRRSSRETHHHHQTQHRRLQQRRGRSMCLALRSWLRRSRLGLLPKLICLIARDHRGSENTRTE
ncbi:hypothetical protein BDZ88DRAFT_430232 [Geranomyces variabilis]|nr:hypothetical protein BDZ88DRAFT_430232 [Geranomyces variabilis]